MTVEEWIMLALSVGIVIDVVGLLALMYEWRRGAKLKEDTSRLLEDLNLFNNKRGGRHG